MSTALILKKKLLLILLLRRIRRKRSIKRKDRKRRRIWVREIFQKRERQGEFHRLVQELKIHDREYFFRYVSP